MRHSSVSVTRPQTCLPRPNRMSTIQSSILSPETEAIASSLLSARSTHSISATHRRTSESLSRSSTSVDAAALQSSRKSFRTPYLRHIQIISPLSKDGEKLKCKTSQNDAKEHTSVLNSSLCQKTSEIDLPQLKRQASLLSGDNQFLVAAMAQEPEIASGCGVPSNCEVHCNPLPSSDVAMTNAQTLEKNRSGRIKVVVRKRPFHSDEAGVDCTSIQPPNVQLSITKQRVDLSEYRELNNFSFDGTFDETVTNEAIYASYGRELLEEALKGGSSSFFAYGQTGSGKTYTMMGNEQKKGLYFLCAMELFQCLMPNHSVLVSFYEIYCNSLYDLLNQRFPVIQREDAKGHVNICGLSWHPVANIEQLWKTMSTGLEQRRTASTNANECSSRSHAVMSIRIQDSNSITFRGRINFVDLAGSESASDASNKDRRVRFEGSEINKSLLALKECIRALDEKKRHIPFRSSRLTEILRDSFIGSCQTVMIANISPSSLDYEHTLGTLRYAFRVKGLTIPTLSPCRARNAPRQAQQLARNRATVASPPLATPPEDTNALPPHKSSNKIQNRLNRTPRDRLTPLRNPTRPRYKNGILASEPILQSAVDVTGEQSTDNQILPLIQNPKLPKSLPSFQGLSTSSAIGSHAAEIDIRGMENRIRRKVMKQLQRDISKDIQQMLDERDVIINKLCQENKQLKEIVSRYLENTFPGSNPQPFNACLNDISL